MEQRGRLDVAGRTNPAARDARRAMRSDWSIAWTARALLMAGLGAWLLLALLSGGLHLDVAHILR